MGFAGGDVNLYRYVFNRSTNFVDPLGLDTILLGATGSGSLLVGGGGSAGVAQEIGGPGFNFTNVGPVSGTDLGAGVFAAYLTLDICEIVESDGTLGEIEITIGPLMIKGFFDGMGDFIGFGLGLGAGFPLGATGGPFTPQFTPGSVPNSDPLGVPF